MSITARYIEFSDKGLVTVQSEEVPTDGLEPWEVVVRNEASLVSAGTELSALHAVEKDITFPRRSGYAAVGRIAAKGEAVTDFAIGDRVFYAGKHASAQRFTHGQNHQWGRLYPVPDAIASEDAVFAGLAEIAMAAPCVTQLDLNDTVAIFGLGLIGNLAAQLYNLMGARVIALDPVAQRCQLAESVGLETVIGVAADRQVDAIIDMTGGKGVAVTVDATGHAAVIARCVEATALFGQVILLGTPRAPYTANLAETLRPIHEKGLVMRGAHQWRFPAMDIREVKKTVPWGLANMFDLIGCGKLKVNPLRSQLVQPEQAPEVYDGLQNDREHYWGVVFDWRD